MPPKRGRRRGRGRKRRPEDTTADLFEFVEQLFKGLQALQLGPSDLLTAQNAKQAADEADAMLRKLEKLGQNADALRRALLQKK